MHAGRRAILGGATLGLGAGTILKTGHLAAQVLTPRQTRGPFYPQALPLDADNDLVAVSGSPGTAAGHVSHVFGEVVDTGGTPMPDALIEIWQCNAWGRYHHPWDNSGAPLDPSFQGYGSTRTDRLGRYRFRTIKPVPYPGRAPHIHFALSWSPDRSLVTQMYVEGSPENATDGLLRRISNQEQRDSLVVAFEPAADQPGELQARFDLVVRSG